jgi:hypothetical protein
MNKQLLATHGIVHAGFRGLRGFDARKKSWCKLIGNSLVIPHDTIPSNVMPKLLDRITFIEKNGNTQKSKFR